MQTWHDVSRSNPCSICGKPDWCCVSTDGAWAICRRVDTGVGRHKQDKSGADFWLYRLDGGSLQQRPAVEVPPPSSRCAATDTLDRIYNGLLNALPLSPAHRQALRQRGLTDSEIRRRQYGTLPLQGRAALAKRDSRLVGRRRLFSSSWLLRGRA